ncbi:hypothetical protein BCR32DRAFT_329764 [Anaeromyces robustus]|uniref:Altered inheritance of mitochondria protein 24, mitochondrial n=1 Tax=Anaeromyces robustus TaxID=1754192 RepID=A0A1Y1WPR9_9FUNG|nr:hypothetical protein BCR32DRAFT_329764 [Anaeromyces robustus]|eukprot:ORX75539.1 hypothetical protein BCR32DRAFT_329764 [Anaeromyces robustus]
MLSKISIINTETNKLLILNSSHFSSKLFSTVSSKGKPTWRITYNEEEEKDSENNEISTQKSFGNININNVSPTKKENIFNSKKVENKINESSVNQISKDRKKIINNKIEKITNYNNPDFEIIKSTNSESVLFAKLNQNSLFYAKYGTVVGLSSKVKIELSYEDNTEEVLKGGNGSGLFAFEKVWTEDKPGQVILVPVNGDLMLINIKKNKEYIVKGKALFSAVSSISVKDYFHDNHKFEGVKYFIVKGKGNIAIEGEGGVLEITLNEDEQFLVKPSTLLAFESQMSVKPVLSSACSEEIDDEILEKQSNDDSSFWKKAKGMIGRAKIYISGDQLFYRLKGPGKFYISTRIPSLSGLQSFKLNNKEKNKNKSIQKRNYSTNSRQQLLDDYEPELENEISSLQKKLMEKTLKKQINKKLKKKENKKRNISKNQSSDRYPQYSNMNNNNNNNNNRNKIITEEEEDDIGNFVSSNQNIIDEKAVLYKKSDKVKTPNLAMFFTSRKSSEEENIEKPLIITPQKSSIDVYLDEDIGEALIQENKKHKNNKFSLSSHQNQNLKSILESEKKENKDRSINSMLEKRTAEIKAEKRRKRQQELNPNRNLDINDNEENIIEDVEDVEEDIDDVDDVEEDVDDIEDVDDVEDVEDVEDVDDIEEDVEDVEDVDDIEDVENVEDIEDIEEDVEDVEDVDDIEGVEDVDEDININDDDDNEEINDDENVNDEIDDNELIEDGNENNDYDNDDIIEEEEIINNNEIGKGVKINNNNIKPKSLFKKKPSIKKNKNSKNKKISKKEKVKLIKPEESTVKKTWTMKENIKDNKFFNFDDKDALNYSSSTISSKNSSSDELFNSSLKKKINKKKLKKSSKLSKQSQLSSLKNTSKKNYNKRNRK